MKKLLFFLSSILMLIGFTACKTKKYSAEHLPQKKIIFGNGGGFTGAASEHILLENGQLFERPPFQDSIIVSKAPIPKKIARQAFKKLKKTDPSLFGVNEPGNRYFYLNYHNGEQLLAAKWGKSGFEIDKEIQSIYDLLIKNIKINKN